MFKACIAVVDAARARLFTFEREAVVEGLRERFLEVTDLVNPRRHDAHRAAHLVALDAAFAREVVAELGALLRATECVRVIVCASPKMLGVLREALEVLPCDRLTIAELARDLSRLSAPQIREHLVDYELLPPTPPWRAMAQPAP